VLDEVERDDLIANHSRTWAYEGIAWYAFN
jgi:hypothetical protein